METFGTIPYSRPRKWIVRTPLAALRLLLGGAVERAEAPNEINAVDAHNVAVREEFGKKAKFNEYLEARRAKLREQ